MEYDKPAREPGVDSPTQQLYWVFFNIEINVVLSTETAYLTILYFPSSTI